MVFRSHYQAKRQISDRVSRTKQLRRKRLAAELLERRDLLAGDVGEEALSCGDLAALSLPDTVITQAVQRRDHCAIRGVIEETINFEVQLPIHAEWNGKFLMLGNGGFAGSILFQSGSFVNDQAEGLRRGYAIAATDTGHQSDSQGDGSWALNNLKAQEDFGYRAVHITAVNAKNIIRAFYDGDIEYSYFQSFSNGGRQGMMESQRFPADFDGIIAGAPAADWVGFMLSFIWNQQSMYPDPENLTRPALPNSKLPSLDAAIRTKCDGLDGLEDGLISDPVACDFVPIDDLPICPEGTEPRQCRREFLTTEVDAIQRIFDGPSNSDGQLFPGFPPGGEYAGGNWANWMTEAGGSTPNWQYAFAQDFGRYFLFDDPTWKLQDFDFEADVARTAEAASILNATDPDLTAFKESGGKLIIFHGWADPAINAVSSIQYHERVVDTLGSENADDFMRLFLLPGFTHLGGSGPSDADWLTALEKWVEEAAPPDVVIASGGQPSRTRPICAHPSHAVWDGEGDPDVADSFSCSAVLTVDTDQDVVDAGDGLTSLREAIATANTLAGVDEIVFDFGYDGPATIQLVQGELELAEAVSIAGSGWELLTIDAQQRSRIFNITATEGDFEIEGLTLVNGRTTGTPANDDTLNGGAIRSVTSGMLTIHATTIGQNSSAGGGGGIGAVGDVVVTSSGILGNSAAFGAGGIGTLGNVIVTSSTISENSVTGGAAIDGGSGSAGGSGGILAAFGEVTVASSTLSGNIGILSGAILASGVTVTSSTISGNSSLGNFLISSGGITGTDVTVTSSTIWENSSAGRGGGGITGKMTIANSIVAGNMLTECSFLCKSDLVMVSGSTVRHSLIGDNSRTELVEAPLGFPDAGGNLIGGPEHGTMDPLLGPLTDTGGPTLTHALLPGSPAIDAGDPLAVEGVEDIPQFDQRGAPHSRIIHGLLDMGAFEDGVVVTVNTDQDVVDAGDGLTSLREAIATANSLAGGRMMA